MALITKVTILPHADDAFTNSFSPGRVLIIVIESIAVLNGMTISVHDINGSQGLVWSLIAHPLPGGEKSNAQRRNNCNQRAVLRHFGE